MLVATLIAVLLAARAAEDRLADVRSVLARTEGASACREDLLARRLVALGPEAAPALLALVSGEALDALLVDDAPEAWLCAPDRIGALALEALSALPRVPVLECLRAETRARPAREVRVAALRVLAAQASAEGLPLLFALLGECGEEIELRSVRAAAHEALLAVLRSDPEALRALEPLLLAAPIEQQRLVGEALGRCGRSGADRLLLKLLGRDRDFDASVIAGLALFAERQPWRAAEVAPRLRKVLGHADPRLRAVAARALGELRDGQAVPALILCLDEADPAVTRAARWALRECTGAPHLVTPDEWQAWLTAERAWWQDEGRAHLAALAPGEERALAETLRALVAHPLGRDSIADALVERMAELTAGEKTLACATLARLGAKKCVPELVELLNEPDDGVRAAAWAALRELTGADLPAEPRPWEDYVAEVAG